jgi:hypothetical protein
MLEKDFVVEAVSAGFIPRDKLGGYKGINDAWICAKCCAIRSTSDELLNAHSTGGKVCTWREAYALVAKEKL